MKIYCNTEELAAAINIVSKAVSSKSSIPYLEGVLLEAECDRLYLTGNDLEICIKTSIPCNISEEGKIVLNCKMLSDIVRKLPKDVCEIKTEGPAVVISCLYSDYRIVGLNANEYPSIPDIEITNSIKISSALLKDMISRTSFAISQKQDRKILTGSLFEINSNTLTIVAVDGYRMALRTEALLGECKEGKFIVPGKAENEVVKIINERVKDLDNGKEKIQFTLAKENYEKTKEIIKDWTEEHDFYLRNKLFLNPLNDFDDFVNCSLESFEDLQIKKEYNELFELIIDDYKMCRGILFSYYKGINNVGKKEMCMTYSYAYSIFDKIAYLLKKVYALKIGDDNTSFTKHGLFDVKIEGTDIRFKDIKNNNVLPLYLIMKEVREKQNIVNALQVGTFEHNELRNAIDHKSIALVSDDKLKRNASILLGHVRNAILYAFMLLHSCNEVELCDKTSAIETTFYKALMNIEQNRISNIAE